MKRPIALVLAALVQLGASAAPATEASVEQLLDVTNARQTLEGSYVQVERMMRNMVRQGAGSQPLTEREQQALETSVVKTMALLKKEFTWDLLKADFVKLYVNTFDQSEIDGLLAFYRSPAGQAFVQKMPVVMQGSMEISQARMQALMPKLMKSLEDTKKEASRP